MPATSSNVTRIFSGSTRRACERPKLPSAPIPPPEAARAREQDEQPDDQQRRAEPEQDLGQQRRALVRVRGVDLDALRLQQRRQVVGVPERRDLGREQRRRRRLGVIGRVALLALERALDRAALGVDRLDLAGVQLLQEVRAERHLHARLPRRRLEDQHRQPVDRQQHEHEDPEAAQAVGWARLVLVGHAAAVGRRRNPPALLIARHRRWRDRLLAVGGSFTGGPD